MVFRGMSIALLLASLSLAPVPPRQARTPAEVVAVVDGDTLVVDVAGARERVRYFGIDTPEIASSEGAAECFGPQAAQRNAQLVGQRVELEADLTERDRFGRLLRYVWSGETLVNAQLVFEGYALVNTYPPDVRYANQLVALQQQAREAGRGLWSSCSRGEQLPELGRRDG